MADEPYDPGAHTVAEVQEYVTANPDQTQAVRDAEAAGKNRSTLVAWLDEPWPTDTVSEQVEGGPSPGGTVTDAGGRPVTDAGGRIVNHDDVDQP